MPDQSASSAHLHAHLDGDARHAHTIEGRSQKALAIALGLTLLYAVVEVVSGFLSNSLALISDAGHMVTDAAALGLALLAQLIARRPPSARHSFGFVRAEALAAFVNSLAMLLLVGWIVFEAAQRLAHPEYVAGKTVLIVAAIGACINITVGPETGAGVNSRRTASTAIHTMSASIASALTNAAITSARAYP